MTKKTKEQEQAEGLKDLGIVIEDKEAVFWKDMKKNSEDIAEQLKKQLKFNEAVIEMCQKKIEGLPNASYIG